jgi:hypothetical protein
MAGGKARGRKGKLGKKKFSIMAYYNSQRWEKNKLRKVRRHIARYGENDSVAMQCVKNLLAALPARYAA